jgi:hypothetical protein
MQLKILKKNNLYRYYIHQYLLSLPKLYLLYKQKCLLFLNYLISFKYKVNFI